MHCRIFGSLRHGDNTPAYRWTPHPFSLQVRPKIKKFLFPITRPCVLKLPLLKLFFFNFTIDKIPNLPRAIRTILPYNSFMLINAVYYFLHKTASILKRLRFVSKMLCKTKVCKTLYIWKFKKNFVKKTVFLPTYPNYFWDVTRNKTFLFFGLKSFLNIVVVSFLKSVTGNTG